MRRDSLVAVLLMAVLAACGEAAPGSGQAPVPATDATPATGPSGTHPVPRVTSDIVSGCVDGAPLVKIVIKLTVGDDKKCHADVTPASVCVVPGGVIRWRIDNDCGPLIGSDVGPALEITSPTFKAHLGGLSGKGNSQASKVPPKLASCALKAPKIEDRSRPGNVLLFCEVDRNAEEGFYKYGLKGQIEPLDPDIEVRR